MPSPKRKSSNVDAPPRVSRPTAQADLPEPTSTTHPQHSRIRIWEILRDVGLSVTAIVTILFAASVFMGFVYEFEFFSDLGVPIEFVMKPTEQYALIGWLLALLWAGFAALYTVILGFILMTLVVSYRILQFSLRPLLSRPLFKDAREAIAADEALGKIQFTRILTLILAPPVYLFAACFVILGSALQAWQLAKHIATDSRPGSSPPIFSEIEIVTQDPLWPSDSQHPTPVHLGGPEGPFLYRGLKFISYNDGRYLLFATIDSETCKPHGIFVIDEDQLINVVILPPDPNSIPAHCRADALSATPVPTPDMTPPPPPTQSSPSYQPIPNYTLGRRAEAELHRPTTRCPAKSKIPVGGTRDPSRCAQGAGRQLEAVRPHADLSGASI